MMSKAKKPAENKVDFDQWYNELKHDIQFQSMDTDETKNLVAERVEQLGVNLRREKKTK